MTLPPQFVERMRALLGDDAPAFFEVLDDAPQTGLRVNTLKTTPHELAQRAGWTLEPVPWCSSGFYVPADIRPGKHPYHAAGLYYLQEPSAMAVAEALDVQPGQRVLDLAAAPGGKATHIAALLGNEGLLVANEIDNGRVKALGENLERWGAPNVVLTNDTPERLAERWGAAFDRVLIDAPCSGEGMFRKNAAAQAEWSIAHVQGCAARQGRILDHAARLVKPHGLLVYSTCTFAPEENEQQIAGFLVAHPDWELVDLPKRSGIAPAQGQWADPPVPELERAARLWPHHVRGEGHFIAALRKIHDDQPSRGATVEQRSRRKDASTSYSSPQAAFAAWRAFEQETLRTDVPGERLHFTNDQIYLLPQDRLPLEGVRVVRPGLWLGTIKPGRFEPSHALALALDADDAQTTVDLSLVEGERYLRGETITRSGASGWVLVAVDGWPLGWGRRTGDLVKNHYPKGLRWLK